MHLKKTFVVSLFATVALLATTADAEPRFNQLPGGNVEVIVDPNPELTGYTVNRLTLDFTGTLTGVQVWLDMESGELYNEATLGEDVPPNSALFGTFPNLEWDSFIADGGYTGADSDSPLIVGNAVNIGTHYPGAEGPRNLDDGINMTWTPEVPPIGEQGPTDLDGYEIAQFTLANNTNGTLYMFASAGGAGFGGADPDSIDAILQVPVANGVIGVIPEPSTFVLLGVGLIGLLALKRRNG